MTARQLAAPPYQGFSEKWRTRFEFFDTTGGPSNKATYLAVVRALSFWKKRLVLTNFFSIFFGFIYWGVFLRLWKKALTLLLIDLALGLVLAILDVPDGVASGIGIGLNLTFARAANYAYYLKQVKGQESWNPIEGLPFF
jgi:hypothetical protein